MKRKSIPPSLVSPASGMPVHSPSWASTEARSGQTNGSVEEVRATYGRWANTAAVTRLTLVSANGANFVAGSFAALYGVGRA